MTDLEIPIGKNDHNFISLMIFNHFKIPAFDLLAVKRYCKSCFKLHMTQLFPQVL